jgi:hypothetical protein
VRFTVNAVVAPVEASPLALSSILQLTAPYLSKSRFTGLLTCGSAIDVATFLRGPKARQIDEPLVSSDRINLAAKVFAIRTGSLGRTGHR